MPYQPILATLGYVLSTDHQSVLLIHRISRKDDEQYGKYNGLGGKMEKEENIANCMVREIKEEADIDVINMKLRGTINWTNFGPNGEDWFGFIFLITKFSGESLNKSNEGNLSWIKINELNNLPMFPGDRYFLPLVFDNDDRIFYGHMPYEKGEMVSWSYNRL